MGLRTVHSFVIILFGEGDRSCSFSKVERDRRIRLGSAGGDISRWTLDER